MPEPYLQNYLIHLSGLSADDFDQRNVAAVNFGDRAEWLEGLRAKSLVSIDPVRPTKKLAGVLQIAANLRHADRPLSSHFDVVFLTFHSDTEHEAREHLSSAAALLASGGLLVVSATLMPGVAKPHPDGFSDVEISLKEGVLCGKATKGQSLDYTETEHVRLHYPMAIKPRWTIDQPNAPIKQVLDEQAPTFLERLSEYEALMPHLLQIDIARTSSIEPFWANGWFPMLDGIALYAETVLREPDIYFEIGSGNSTKFVRRAIKDHKLKTKIISVDPSPRAEVDGICDKVFRTRFEEFDIKHLLAFKDSNVFLFMDGSHYSFPNSDVNLFFLEILPQVPRSWLLGVHDIIWPYDYLNLNMRFFNEQYVLAPFLLSRTIEPTFAATYLTLDPGHQKRTAQLLSPIAAQGGGWAGGACFLFESRL